MNKGPFHQWKIIYLIILGELSIGGKYMWNIHISSFK